MYGVNNIRARLGLYNLTNVDDPGIITDLAVQELYMDGTEAELLLQILKSSVQQIQNRQYSKLNFEDLYRYGYYLVQHNFGNQLHSKLEEVITEYIISKVQSEVLTNLNDNFLSVINNAWDHHHATIKIISDVLKYLDRVYLNQQGKDSIYKLGLNLFRDLVVCYGNIQRFLRVTLLNLVMKERQGELVDRSAFRKTTELLVVLDENNRSIYKEIFEEPFLQESKIFYKMEGQQLSENDNASCFLMHARKRLHEEIERSEQCYHETTSPQIIKIVEDELIKANMNTIVQMSTGVVYMIQNQMTDDLACLYYLLSRVSDGINILSECISNYLLDEGVTLMRSEECNNSALTYIQSLLDLKENIDFYLINSFSNDRFCKQKITSAFERMLNINTKSAEYLSVFIDEKLKKNVKGMADDEKRILLDQTMVLFRFLQDKDLFLHYYKQDLAKRLIFSKTINEENEKCVINKFKAECGTDYTSTLVGMFHDIWSSSLLTEQFNQHAASTGALTGEISINMRVLKSFNWPTQNVPSSCNLPAGPLAAFQAFKKFYMLRHSGRVLNLLPQLGSAEVQSSFPQPHTNKKNKKNIKEVCYTLYVTTYQMCVLMKFNQKSEWTFQELLQETRIPVKDLKKALQSLITGGPSLRVLHKNSESPKIESDDSFSLNDGFTSKTNRVKIPSLAPVKYETETERQDTLKSVNESRRFEIDAAIIRVMKSKRNINHDNLINEVVKILRKRFTPMKETIKTRIESLIQTEHITRKSEDRNVYQYIP